MHPLLEINGVYWNFMAQRVLINVNEVWYKLMSPCPASLISPSVSVVVSGNLCMCACVYNYWTIRSFCRLCSFCLFIGKSRLCCFPTMPCKKRFWRRRTNTAPFSLNVIHVVPTADFSSVIVLQHSKFNQVELRPPPVRCGAWRGVKPL